MSSRPSPGARSSADTAAALRGLPSGGEIDAALEAVLASAVFAQAGRSRELLRFVVAETLAGRGERLKGYTIAVEVFQRSADFDAQSDPLVRVEAGRLRKRLTEYYHGVGRNDLVRIALPRGGYAPTFEYTKARLVANAARKDVSPPIVATPRRRWPEVVLAGIAVASLAVAAVVVGTRDAPTLGNAGMAADPPEAAAIVARGAGAATRLLVMPLRDLSDAGIGGFAGGLSEELVRALLDYNVVAIATPNAGELESKSMPQLRSEFGARFALAGSVRVADDVARVAVRIVDTNDGTLFWASSFDEPLKPNMIAVEERVANTIAATLASYLGPIYAREVDRVAAKPAAELTSRECVLRYYGYLYSFDSALRADSVACLNRSVASEPNRAAAWAGLSMLAAHEVMYGAHADIAHGEKLDRALEAARTALELDGQSRPAAIALATVAQARGDREAFGRTVERAIALKPAHPAIMINAGFMLIVAGEAERGIDLLDAGAPLIYRTPNFMHVGYALGYLQTQHYDQALREGLRIDFADWPFAQLVKIAAVAQGRRPEVAVRELRRMKEFYPHFETLAPGWLARAQLDPSAEAAVRAGLETAGVSLR